MKRLPSNFYSLPARLVFSFLALVLLVAAAVGLPALWVIRGQLERQAWALLTQGERTTRALYAGRAGELTNLALVSAQRPTLLALLESGDRPALETYLETLRTGAGLDLVAVCGEGDQTLAQAGSFPTDGLCASSQIPGGDLTGPFFHAGPEIPGAEGQAGAASPWLMSLEPVSQAAGTSGAIRPERVIVGRELDSGWAAGMRAGTGVDQILLVDGQAVASSFAGDDQANSETALQNLSAAGSGSFHLGRSLYYASRFPLTELVSGSAAPAGLETVIALNVTDLVAAQDRLTLAMGGGLVVVAALGSALGILLARRIGRPLAQLGSAAVALQKGDLATPVRVRTGIPEAAAAAHALEDARVALQGTLTELRREKDWIEHLLAAIVEGIVTLDGHGRITYFSHGAELITGWKAEQVLMRSCDEVFPPAEGRERFSANLPAPGGKQKILVVLRSGRKATLAVTGARLGPPEAGKARVALVLRDVSDEEAVRRLLGDFLANISHEFRTPLSALAASIELLLDQLPDLSPEELEELLNSLHLGIRSLQTLIDNLLEGASIETGSFRVYPRPTQVDEIVLEATRLMQPLLDRYGQRLALCLPEDLPPVLADPRRTGQALVNLLSNAIKHSPEGAEIDLSVKAIQNPAGRQPGGTAGTEAQVGGRSGERGVIISVADCGPGIPPAALPDIFRRFAHLDSGSERAESGAGLGLSVVKAIVEAQGGRVGAANRPGGGALFWFTLSFADENLHTTKDAKET